MSSLQASDDEIDPSEEETREEGAGAQPVVETTECPNCGRAFVGDYCPACGQEAAPSASVVEVIGGFFRELVDLEHGFWPTFVGLTVRPGEMLRAYRRGVRKGLTNPGRYLLAAVIVDVTIDRLLAWMGAKDLSWTDSGPTSAADGGGEPKEGFWATFDVTAEQVGAIFEGPDARIIGVLLTAALFAVLLYRLFADELEQMGEGLAVACFLVAHATLLSRGADLLYVGTASLYTGQPVDSPSLFTGVVFAGYAGFAIHSCFDPGWKSALKGAFGLIWAYVEAISMGLIVATGYAGWLLLTHPGEYVPAGGLSEIELLAVAFLGFVAGLPLLLHAGVELYYRWGGAGPSG